MLKHVILIPVIAFACVGLAVVMNESEGAGLFGAIIAVGYYCALTKEPTPC